MANGTLTSNTSTEWVSLPEGEAVLILYSTFGGGTAQLYVQAADGSTAVSVNSAAWTSQIVTNVSFGGGVRVRFTLAGATNPSLKWEIHPKMTRAVSNRPQGALSYRY